MTTPTIQWIGDAGGHLRLLDQTKLPRETVVLDCHTVDDVWWAIKKLAVRGAPAIGIAAAYGAVLAARDSTEDFRAACGHLADSRPTAVNLSWALERMQAVADSVPAADRPERLLAEARAIHAEDREQCAAIGRHGADHLQRLLSAGSGVLTHCNTGALATGGDGTALAVLFELHRRGFGPHVYADETRPLLQGSRLTMWELAERGVRATLICDSMAAQVMQSRRVQAAIVGADRIAANGDTANKIGTYGVAQLCRAHDLPFFVAAPSTTFDLTLDSGAAIPIEERAAEEVTEPGGVPFAPAGVDVYNPAFDVTPGELIAGIITERGVLSAVTAEAIRQHLQL